MERAQFTIVAHQAIERFAARDAAFELGEKLAQWRSAHTTGGMAEQ
jgi:hypothetical protein